MWSLFDYKQVGSAAGSFCRCKRMDSRAIKETSSTSCPVWALGVAGSEEEHLVLQEVERRVLQEERSLNWA